MEYNIYYQTIAKVESEIVCVSTKMEHINGTEYCEKTTELMNRANKDNYKKSYSQVLNETGGFDFHLTYTPSRRA